MTLLAAVTAVPTLTAAQSATAPDRPTIGGTVTENLTEAYGNFSKAKGGIAQAELQLRGARVRFWKLFPNDPGIDAATRELERLLTGKDLYHLGWVLGEGFTNRLSALRGMLEYDDGIPASAFPAFRDWVVEFRRELGAQRSGDLVLLINPVPMTAAFTKTADLWDAYVRARDMAELAAGGIDLSKHFPPKAYALQLIEYRLSANPADLRKPDPEAKAEAVYRTMVATVGEPAVLAAATRVLRAPKARSGFLAKSVRILERDGFSSTRHPWLLFLNLIAEDPRGFVARMYLSERGDPEYTWTQVLRRYRTLEQEFGADRVVDTARRVLSAPKSPSGRLANGERLSSAFEKLLANSDTELHADPPRLEATQLEALRSAAKTGGAAVVTGVVSHVTDIHDPRYQKPGRGGWHLYFAGASETELVVTIYDAVAAAEFTNRFGLTDGATHALVGKRIDVYSDSGPHTQRGLIKVDINHVDAIKVVR